ncbi:MAG: hypothetical protein ABEI06_02265 [Halobacteriaceae archaeon]
MPDLNCPDCGQSIAMHELETSTVAQSEGFKTKYRCPFCHTDFEDIDNLM